MRIALALIIACCLGCGARGPAAEPGRVAIASQSFPERITANGADLQLANGARYSYLWFDVYVGVLYVAPGAKGADLLADVPKRVEFHYLRELSAADFRKATRDSMRRLVDDATWARLQPGIDQLNAAYLGVKAGDRQALTYRPGAGTELALNGRTLALVPGEEFARILFSVWFGPKPLDEGFRDACFRPR